MSEARLVICSRPPSTAERGATQAAWRAKLGPQTMALQRALGFERYAQVHCVGPGHPMRRLLAFSRSRRVASLVARTAPDRGTTVGARADAILARAEHWTVLDELWWPSVDALLTATTSESGLHALTQLRESRAPYTEATAAVVCREIIVGARREMRPDTTRVGFCLRPRPGDTPEQMQSYWRGRHAELVRALGEQLGFDQYDLAQAVLDDPRVDTVVDALGGTQDRPYLGFASLSYPTVAKLVLGHMRPTAQIANFKLMRDELAFIDPPSSPPVIGTRVPIG